MNILSLLNSLPGSVAQGLIWGILAMGIYVTYKVLDIADLTVDGSLCTGGAVAAVAIAAGVDPSVAVLLALFAGMLAGLVTGILHTGFKIPAILSGILTQLALYSINMRIMGKSNVTISRTKYNLLLTSFNNTTAIVVSAVFVLLVIGILYWFFGTELGSAIRATGGNECMARAQGINTDRMKVLGLVISNGLVGLAGGVLAQYQGNADINMGRGAIVIGLAAVVIGEVTFGRVSNFAVRLFGTTFGAIVYYAVLAFVLWLGLETTDLKLFSAITVAVFLSVPQIKKIFSKVRIRKGGH
ncbi:MAG: ABC transporter permease [Clostridia bacterium]|nr:ABC transporter permease [Clostridia bacterium]